MKSRLLALGLCICLALSLCACTAQNNSEDPLASPPASLEPEGEPSPSPAPDEEPALVPGDGGQAEGSDPAPSDQAGTSPIETAPADESEEQDAAFLYAMWLTTSEQFPAPCAAFVDMSDYVDNFYTTFTDSDAESFVFYQHPMSATPQEVFLAKAKPGKVSAIKAACQGRLEAMEEETKFYTGTDDYVKSAKLITAGDWVLLAVCPESDRLVNIVQTVAK